MGLPFPCKLVVNPDKVYFNEQIKKDILENNYKTHKNYSFLFERVNNLLLSI